MYTLYFHCPTERIIPLFAARQWPKTCNNSAVAETQYPGAAAKHTCERQFALRRAKSVAICVYCGAIVKFIGRSEIEVFAQRADLHLREIKFKAIAEQEKGRGHQGGCTSVGAKSTCKIQQVTWFSHQGAFSLSLSRSLTSPRACSLVFSFPWRTRAPSKHNIMLLCEGGRAMLNKSFPSRACKQNTQRRTSRTAPVPSDDDDYVLIYVFLRKPQTHVQLKYARSLRGSWCAWVYATPSHFHSWKMLFDPTRPINYESSPAWVLIRPSYKDRTRVVVMWVSRLYNIWVIIILTNSRAPGPKVREQLRGRNFYSTRIM